MYGEIVKTPHHLWPTWPDSYAWPDGTESGPGDVLTDIDKGRY